MDKSSSASNPSMSSQNNPNPTPSGTGAETNQQNTRPSSDIGWKWGFLPNLPHDRMTTQCKLCKHQSKCGVYRLKQHIAGIGGSVMKCPLATPQDRQEAKEALQQVRGKKIEKARLEVESRDEVQVSRSRINHEEDISLIGNKRPREIGSIHRYATFLPDEPTNVSNKGKQTSIDEGDRRKRRELVHEWVSLWCYEAGVPFHALTIPSFGNMCEAIGQYGPGYVGPTMYQLREPLLKKALERTSKGLESHRKEWATNGCSIMTDSWTDQKSRCVVNLCVHCSGGVSFYKSKEESATSHTGEFIFEWVDQCIEEIGPSHVIQVVTDNHSANMTAKHMLKEKRPRIFWTSCAAHTIDLMLQDIGKISKFKNTIEKAKSLTRFIYAHHRTLALMRQCTKCKDIVRPGITRFATSFLTLSSLLDKKECLIAMFSSPEYTNMKFVGDARRKSEMANATVISKSFWNSIKFCLKIFSPLFRLLRMVDSDKYPSMGFIVGELLVVKREIMAAYKNIEKDYKPILNIIEGKAKGRLDSHLHLAAWFLNPLYYYAEEDVVRKSALGKAAVLECAEAFFEDEDIHDKIHTIEMLRYKKKDGLHGRPMAQRGVKLIANTRNPGHWWDTFGGEMPYLQIMAIKILNLTGSSSGCERNWSTFQGIHTKKRNRLDSKRLSDLVYVKFNLRIRSKLNTKRKDGKERDILLAKDAKHATSWVVDEDASDDDNEDLYPGTDIPLRVVSEAAGADDFLQPRRSTRRTLASSSAQEAPQFDYQDEEIESDEEDIPLHDSDSDGDALRDEIMMLGTASSDEED